VSDGFAGLTVEAARRQLAALLRAHGTDTPDLDARLLVGAALGLDLTGLAIHAGRLVDAAEGERLVDFARRRSAGEPVARIVGVKEFWGLALKLSATTLVPRPDTETVVEAAVDLVRRGADAPRRLLDIGTGTGALLLALLSEFPGAIGIGTDIDTDALATAAENARLLQLADRAAFLHGNYADAVTGDFDLIVSNPPYIPSSEIATLAVEVRLHDPRCALDGGEDGLDAYRQIIPGAARLLRTGGALLLEIGLGQGADVGTMVEAAGLDLAPPRPDLAGIPRVIIGHKTRPERLPEP
jgi:release factor glutamine methyltransferase